MQFTRPVPGNAEDGQRYAEGCFVGVDNHRVCICIPIAGGTFIALYPPPIFLLWNEEGARIENERTNATSSGKKLMLRWFSIAIILLRFNSFAREFGIRIPSWIRGEEEKIYMISRGIECVFREYLRRACVDSSGGGGGGGDLKMEERACRCLDTFYERCTRFQNLDRRFLRTDETVVLMFEKGFQINFCNFLNNYRIRRKYFSILSTK